MVDISPPDLTPRWHLRAGTRTAQVLDRLADAELQHGHHLIAERLAQLAAQMREAAA